MADIVEPAKLGDEGKRHFSSGRFEAAADAFDRAAQGYARLNDAINAAEQKNNYAVALLKLGRAQEAFDSVTGTDAIFAAAGDSRRQGIALNNQAMALEALSRPDDALASYERSAKLLGDAGEGEMRATVLKSAAAIRLRRGKITESGMDMLDALGSTPKPTFFERVLKALLRLTR